MNPLCLLALLPLLAPLHLPLPTGAAPQEPQQKPAPVDPVQKRLETSPRHHEWIDVKSGERTLRCFVVFPEVKEKAAAVLVIHENKGLTDWVRSVADQLAEAGYIAIAPDMISGMGPEKGNTESFKSVDDATKAIYKLEPAGVSADLGAVADAVLELPACNGQLSVAGFCWGGSQTFEFATRRKGLTAACVFYGSAPKDGAALAKIECPVYGFYGESDNRINAGLDETKELMKKAGKVFEPVIYAGAGHGFLRAGESAEASKENKQAHADAWKRWKEILAKPAAVAK